MVLSLSKGPRAGSGVVPCQPATGGGAGGPCVAGPKYGRRKSRVVPKGIVPKADKTCNSYRENIVLSKV